MPRSWYWYWVFCPEALLFVRFAYKVWDDVFKPAPGPELTTTTELFLDAAPVEAETLPLIFLLRLDLEALECTLVLPPLSDSVAR